MILAFDGPDPFIYRREVESSSGWTERWRAVLRRRRLALHPGADQRQGRPLELGIAPGYTFPESVAHQLGERERSELAGEEGGLLLALGYAHERKPDTEKALELYRRAARLVPGSGGPHYRIGRA